ncbi:MAG: hypothetical protein EA428_08380 [Spirochaetaceae bacterium]|nr:MAG: hypothetical protein EA428_08380 [Spirochaetaceae bacterium]
MHPNLSDPTPLQAIESATAEFELSSGRVYLRLPFPNLCSLADYLRGEPEERSYALMLHVSKAAALLPEDTGFALDPTFVFLSSEAPLNSGVVFLPASGASELRRLQKTAEHRHEGEQHDHDSLDFDPPDRTDSAITAFGLAALWYRRLSSQPFCMNPKAEPGTPRIYERFEESFPTLPTDLQKVFDACIEVPSPAATRSMEHHRNGARFITELVDMLPDSSVELSQALETGGLEADVLRKRRARAERLRKDRVRRFQRRDFLRRRGARLALVSALVLVLGGIVGTSIDRALQPPPTHGLSAKEVVQLHYAALNKLDPELLRATVARGVATQRVDEVTNMYVTSRARMSVEMKTGNYPADDWINQGRPDLGPTVYPYGVSTPDIRELNKEEGSALYEARFIRVFFEFEDEISEQDASIREYHVREELQLELRNEVWRIVALDSHVVEPSSESH